MTLSAALRRLDAARAFDADPGPVRHARGYVRGLLDRGELETAVDPMLTGALLALLRHLTGDPRAYVVSDSPAWSAHAGPWRATWENAACATYRHAEGDTEIGALVEALSGFALRAPRPLSDFPDRDATGVFDVDGRAILDGQLGDDVVYADEPDVRYGRRDVLLSADTVRALGWEAP